MTLEERIARGGELHRTGYNCAQCVILAHIDRLGITEEDGASMAAMLGLGMGGGKEVCGAASAQLIAAGILAGPDPKKKPQNYAVAREILDTFAAENGYVRCADLKRPPQVVPCSKLIENGIRQLDGLLTRMGR